MTINRLSPYTYRLVPVAMATVTTAVIPVNMLWTGYCWRFTTAPIMFLPQYGNLSAGTFTTLQRNYMRPINTAGAVAAPAPLDRFNYYNGAILMAQSFEYNDWVAETVDWNGTGAEASIAVGDLLICVERIKIVGTST